MDDLNKFSPFEIHTNFWDHFSLIIRLTGRDGCLLWKNENSLNPPVTLNHSLIKTYNLITLKLLSLILSPVVII